MKSLDDPQYKSYYRMLLNVFGTVTVMVLVRGFPQGEQIGAISSGIVSLFLSLISLTQQSRIRSELDEMREEIRAKIGSTANIAERITNQLRHIQDPNYSGPKDLAYYLEQEVGTLQNTINFYRSLPSQMHRLSVTAVDENLNSVVSIEDASERGVTPPPTAVATPRLSSPPLLQSLSLPGAVAEAVTLQSSNARGVPQNSEAMPRAARAESVGILFEDGEGQKLNQILPFCEPATFFYKDAGKHAVRCFQGFAFLLFCVYSYLMYSLRSESSDTSEHETLLFYLALSFGSIASLLPMGYQLTSHYLREHQKATQAALEILKQDTRRLKHVNQTIVLVSNVAATWLRHQRDNFPSRDLVGTLVAARKTETGGRRKGLPEPFELPTRPAKR